MNHRADLIRRMI